MSFTKRTFSHNTMPGALLGHIKRWEDILDLCKHFATRNLSNC